MSKSLHAKVEAEIRRREDERLKKEAAEEKARQDEAKEAILKMFDEIFDEHLKKLEDANSMRVSAHRSEAIYLFRAMAEELGFIVERRNNGISLYDSYYLLFVPAFQKGNKRTPAQLRLHKFEQKLSKVRREKRVEMLAECKRVKQLIEEGKYGYQTAKEGYPAKIWVESGKEIDTAFEKAVVETFFYKLNFTLQTCSNGRWLFKV